MTYEPDIRIEDAAEFGIDSASARQVVDEATGRHERAVSSEFFLAQVALDAPGLVHDLVERLLDFRANVEAATQVRLGHLCITMVVVSIESTEQQIELLQAVEQNQLESRSGRRLNVMCLRSPGDQVRNLWHDHEEPVNLRLESERGVPLVDHILRVAEGLRAARIAVLDMVAYCDRDVAILDGLVLPPLSADPLLLEELASAVAPRGNLASGARLSRYREPMSAVSAASHYIAVVGVARVGLVHDIVAALTDRAVEISLGRTSVLEGRTAVLLGCASPPDPDAIRHAIDDLRGRGADNGHAGDRGLRFRLFEAEVPEEEVDDRSSWWTSTVEVDAVEARGVIKRVTGVLLLADLNIDRMDTRVTRAADGVLHCKAVYEVSRALEMSELQMSRLRRRLVALDDVVAASVIAGSPPRTLPTTEDSARGRATLGVSIEAAGQALRIRFDLDPDAGESSASVDVASNGLTTLAVEVWSEDGVKRFTRHLGFDTNEGSSWTFDLSLPQALSADVHLLLLSRGATVWSRRLELDG